VYAEFGSSSGGLFAVRGKNEEKRKTVERLGEGVEVIKQTKTRGNERQG